MKEIIVFNVTNWIGYHLTEHLLNQGYLVKGIKGTEGLDHLGDFFERNSNFKWMSESDLIGNYAVGVSAFNPPAMAHNKFDHLFIINGAKEKKIKGIFIHAPLLFGEWMPIIKEERFKKYTKEGIYIQDFLKALLPLLESPPDYSEIELRSERKKEEKKLENYLLVTENDPIEEKLSDVMNHYERFQALYPETE